MKCFNRSAPSRRKGPSSKTPGRIGKNAAASIALILDQPDHVGFAVLIPLLPPDYRPLLKALVDENNELLVRVRQRARQNHLLLSRSLELMQGLLNTLMPAREMRVYNDHGNMHTHTIVTRSFYEAVG